MDQLDRIKKRFDRELEVRGSRRTDNFWLIAEVERLRSANAELREEIGEQDKTIARLRDELDGPVEFPPPPDVVCKERATEAMSGLQVISTFAREEGRPGFCDKASFAIKVIKDLADSYLECCADNDRLRKYEDAVIEIVKNGTKRDMRATTIGLSQLIVDNPRPGSYQ